MFKEAIMNQRASALLLLLIVVLGFGGFVLYDFKTNNRLGLRKEDPKNNWNWDDDWNKTNPIEQPKEPEKPVLPKEQVVAGSYAEAIKKAAELKMPVLVFFEADWCTWCKKLKQETLTNTKVKEAMKKYIVVYVNTDKDRATGKKFGVRYLPTYVVTNAQEAILKSDGGFKTPDQFVQWLGEPSKPDGDQPKGDQPDKKKVQPKGDQPPDRKKVQPKGDGGNQSPERRRFRRPQMCSEINLDD